MKLKGLMSPVSRPTAFAYGLGIVHAMAVMILASVLSAERLSVAFKGTVFAVMMIGLGISAHGFRSRLAQYKARS